MRWLAGAVVLGVLGAFFLDSTGIGGARWDGKLPVRVTGVVIDARSGAPVRDASLLTLKDPAIADDPEALARWRASASEGLRSADGRLSYWFRARARTNDAGEFEIVVGIWTSGMTAWSGRQLSWGRGTAFETARALLVEKEGYSPLVHDTRGARWIEREGMGGNPLDLPEEDIVGTLEIGTIRLQPGAR